MLDRHQNEHSTSIQLSTGKSETNYTNYLHIIQYKEKNKFYKN